MTPEKVGENTWAIASGTTQGAIATNL